MKYEHILSSALELVEEHRSTEYLIQFMIDYLILQSEINDLDTAHDIVIEYLFNLEKK